MTSIVETELQAALSAVQASIKGVAAKVADATSVQTMLAKAEADIKAQAGLLGIALKDAEGFVARVEGAVEAALGIKDADEAQPAPVADPAVVAPAPVDPSQAAA